MSADYTFVNDIFAKHYGMPNVLGNRFRRVQREINQEALVPDDAQRSDLGGFGWRIAVLASCGCNGRRRHETFEGRRRRSQYRKQ